MVHLVLAVNELISTSELGDVTLMRQLSAQHRCEGVSQGWNLCLDRHGSQLDRCKIIGSQLTVAVGSQRSAVQADKATVIECCNAIFTEHGKPTDLATEGTERMI